ncbi:MAG: trypsin-like peptidase domain-containing protein [Patescibacteria group bacterium]
MLNANIPNNKPNNLTNYKSGIIGGVAGGVIVIVALFAIITYQPLGVSLNLQPEQNVGGATIAVNDQEQELEPVEENNASEVIPLTPPDISDIVEQVNPAVVSIAIFQDVPVMEQYYEDPFKDFFGGNSPFQFQIPRYRQNGTQQKEVGGGSGFIISADGYIVTNAHVVLSDDAQYKVYLLSGESYDALVIARDDVLDIALIKIEATGLEHLAFGDSDKLRLGERVIAIGNALAEFNNSVSVGIVSGLSRSITAGNGIGFSEALENVIQTDAAINPGNSGGPLLNMKGEVVGVNVAVAMGSENIGFALPSNAVKPVVEMIKEHGRVVRPYLGVRYMQINAEVAQKNSLPYEYGALVLRGENQMDLAVIPGSPADLAGLVENDIILEINSKKLDADTQLASMIRKMSVGDEITLKVYHKGEEIELKVALTERPQ